MNDDFTIEFVEGIDGCTVDEICRYILMAAPLFSDWPVSGKHVSDVLKYAKPHERNRQYHQFEIPKKSGGTRQIIAPVGDLKVIQKVLAHLLAMVSSPNEHAHGFIEKRSVITNAQQHIGKNYVLNLDLKNFFPGIYFHHVVNALQMYFSRDVSVFIAKLCTWTETGDDLPEDVLPQGAPTSPVLSNIVCEAMDARLGGPAKRFGLTYTRYADDDRSCRLYRRIRYSHRAVPMLEQH